MICFTLILSIQNYRHGSFRNLMAKYGEYALSSLNLKHSFFIHSINNILQRLLFDIIMSSLNLKQIFIRFHTRNSICFGRRIRTLKQMTLHLHTCSQISSLPFYQHAPLGLPQRHLMLSHLRLLLRNLV